MTLTTSARLPHLEKPTTEGKAAASVNMNMTGTEVMHFALNRHVPPRPSPLLLLVLRSTYPLPFAMSPPKRHATPRRTPRRATPRVATPRHAASPSLLSLPPLHPSSTVRPPIHSQVCTRSYAKYGSKWRQSVQGGPLPPAASASGHG